MKKWIWILFLFFIVDTYAQSSSQIPPERFTDYVGWTPWKEVFNRFMESLIYLVPGLLLLAIPAMIFQKSEERNKSISKVLSIILALISLAGVPLIIYGAFLLIPLFANLEYLLWTVIYLGIAIIVIVLIGSWLYEKVKNKLNKTTNQKVAK